MLSPAIAMMMARARESEVRFEAERFSVTAGDEGIHRQRRHYGLADGPSARRLLVSKSRELIRLADSLDCKRDELVRMIRSLS
jgi:hypothetical protein